MIVTAEEVRQILDSPEKDDAKIEVMIKRKQRIMERYIGRAIEETEYNEYYDAVEGAKTLNLRNYPVITVDGLWKVSISGETVVDSDYYYVYKDRGILKLLAGRTFTEGIRTVRVKYDAGYAEGSIPEDFKDVCIDLVSAQYLFSQLLVHEIEADSGIAKKKVLEDSAWKILDSYRGVKV